MSEIRVTYSGLISFIAGLITLGTGLVFTIIVTRSLSQLDYGTWGLITSLFVYGVLASEIINFWTVRDVARGKKVGKLSLVSSSSLSSIGICIYLVIALLVAPESSVEINFLIIAAILIPMQFLRKASTGINLGWKPQLLGYGSIISGIVSVPLALFLIYFLDWSIIGIVFSLAIAEGANVIFQVVCAREKIKAKIDFAILKRWFKFSWVPLYPKISNLLVFSDVIIFSVITGSVIGVSYHSAALVIATLVGYAAAISASVYPKLLSGDKGKIITRNLTNFFYFAILLVFLAITFAKPGLFILNPIYEIAALVVIFSTFRILFFYLTNICESFLIGVENVDNESKSNFKDYMKSKLFFLPTLRLIQYAVYIVVLTIVLVSLNNSTETIELVVYWSIIAMIFQIPLVLYLLYAVKQTFPLKSEIKSIAKYIFAGLVSFALVYFLIENFLTYSEVISEFLPQVVLLALLGVSMYALITYAIDKPTRDLIKAAILEIKK